MNAADSLQLSVDDATGHAGEIVEVDSASLAASASGLGELAINTEQDSTDALGMTSKYEIVVTQAQHHSDALILKRIHDANATTRVYGLVNSADVKDRGKCPSSSPESDVYNGFGLNYCWVQKNNSQWILRDQSGNPLKYSDNGLVMMDVGSASYRSAWATMVENYFRESDDPNPLTTPFDGVYLDDVNTTPGHGVDGQVRGETDAQYGADVTGFMAFVGSELHSDGL